MAYLLGSDYCIQSLSNDISDVQCTIKDILNKTGRINSVSWKFPDKLACDLNIADYLNTYKYDSEDCENNQVAHIVLLELTIDRLCLMMQLHCDHIDKIIIKERSVGAVNKTVQNQNNKTISPCLGLTAKKHWNKMSQLSIFVDNLQKEILQQKKINKELLLDVEKLRANNHTKGNNDILSLNSDNNLSAQASEWLQSMDNEQKSIRMSQKPVSGSISKDVGFKSSQTLDTAFKPCESCHISQTCFREMSSVLMQILNEESQTSSLYKLNQDLRSMDWLSDKKLLQVKESFIKDFNKLCMFYRDIRKVEIKTSEDLNVTRKLCDKLRADLKEEKEQMDIEKNRFTAQKLDLESQIKDQTTNLKATQSKIHTMTDEFNNKYKQLQKELADLNLKVVDKEKDSHMLAKLKMTIMDFKQNSEDPIKDLFQIKNMLEDQANQIAKLNLSIESQKAVNNNLSEIEHSAMEKENKLMKRLQNLSDQKRKLEEKIDSLEIKLDNASGSMKELENQNLSLSLEMKEKNNIIERLTNVEKECTEKIHEFQNQLCAMEEAIRELEKDKQLLINFPDLEGPLEKYDSGNVAEDIHMQIKANSARIKILSQHNTDLGNALEKLKETGTTVQGMGDFNEVVNVHPVSDLKLIISRPMSNMSSTFHPTSRQRPPRHPTPTKANSLEIQSQILQWSTTTQKSSTPKPCVCETCGRQYNQKSDLEVHKEYCAGRRRKINQK